MRVICPISGMEVYKTPYLLGFSLADVHPIFRAKRKLILTPEMVNKFAKATSYDEKKLIFLAVLNATELVEFRVPAAPSLQVVETNFYKLMHTASWLNMAEYVYKQAAGFPQFVVDKGTADLTSVSAWREEIESIRDALINRDLNRERVATLHQKGEEIKRELGQAAFLGRSFTPNLARWALDFAGLDRTDDRFPLYVKILCTPLADSYIWEIDQLREIETFLENELPADHPQVISVMFQMRELIKKCKTSFTDFAVFNDHDETGESFTIIDDVTGEVKQSAHLIDVPTSQPRQSDYVTKTAYLVADAKWRLANRTKQLSVGADDV